MKNLMLLIAILGLSACSTKDGDKVQDPHPVTSRANGGVDVGNMTAANVPQTNASISYPANWSSTSTSNLLSINNKSGSSIEFKKSEIADLTSLDSLSLQKYLKSKYPDRSYKIINFNGLEGVRAELVDTPIAKSSDIYILSELKDFIHIQSNLKKEDNGITEGDDIILSVRVKYQGVPYPDAQIKTVKIESRVANANTNHHAYSFWSDCYTYSDETCNRLGGVAVAYEPDFKIGTSGGDHGRVVELGSESQIPFDSIRVDGDYLLAPISNIPISDIYTIFTPKDPNKDQRNIKLKEGYVYLVRTIRWPDEDLITKMLVEKVKEGDFAKITYQKLVYVKKNELQKQVDLINKNTIENEMQISNGEVILYNQSVWHNYFYASFNFQYSTSGNMFITRNGWDLTFSYGCTGKLSFMVPHTASAIGQVIDIGEKDISAVSLTDFPDPNTFKSDCGTDVLKGHTYLVYHYDYDDDEANSVFGAVQVIDLDPTNQWVRLKFRRIKIGPADYFQKWVNLTIPDGVQKVILEKTSNWLTGIFFPFLNKRGDFGSSLNNEKIEFSSFSGNENYLRTDSRPYGNKRGFYKLGNNIPLDKITVAEVEALKGNFDNYMIFNKGDVIAILLDNYYDRTVMVIRVDEHKPNKSVELSIKYLERGKAPYSEEN